MAILADKGLLQERVGSSEVIPMLALTLTRGALEAGFPATGTNKRAKHTRAPHGPTNHPTHNPQTTPWAAHTMHIPHSTHPPSPRLRHLCHVHYATYTLARTHTRTHTHYTAYTPHSASIVVHTELYNRNHDNSSCSLGTHSARHCSGNFA